MMTDLDNAIVVFIICILIIVAIGLVAFMLAVVDIYLGWAERRKGSWAYNRRLKKDFKEDLKLIDDHDEFRRLLYGNLRD